MGGSDAKVHGLPFSAPWVWSCGGDGWDLGRAAALADPGIEGVWANQFGNVLVTSDAPGH
jgi:hypothetical protein